jgi:pimeloyl-ACP methyl ester carboxylesterase
LGAGPPVILLHASPLSSAFMGGQMAALAAAGFEAIALDTPGYGQSDPLPSAPSDLDAYGDALLSAVDALGLAQIGLYGTATGAQLALAMARQAPKRISRLVLDNCALFTAEDVAAWEERYFPDLSPKADGSHLSQLWTVARRQFVAFPWFSEAPVDQLNRGEPPLAMVQTMAQHFFIAGPAYDQAYRLAFHNERAESFAGLTVPTVLIDWQGSIVRRQCQALIAQGLPACVTVTEAAPSPDARFAAIAAAFAA